MNMIRKNSKKIHSKIVSLLLQRHFPEKYGIDKITQDMPKYAKLVHNEQKNKIFSKFHNLIRKIQRNIQNNIYNDIAKIKTDIQSIPNQCIEFIIKNKLILTGDLE